VRAYLHDGQEPRQLHPKTGYIEARPNYSIFTNFSCNAPPVHTSGSLADLKETLNNLQFWSPAPSDPAVVAASGAPVLLLYLDSVRRPVPATEMGAA
jgi:hypothetical protein